jgi:hypothetical protein
MSKLLRPEERKGIESAVDGKLISMAIVRLYHAAPSNREYTLLQQGALCLTYNGQFSFNLVDIDVLKINTRPVLLFGVTL